jgi:general secretion pathway protein I
MKFNPAPYRPPTLIWSFSGFTLLEVMVALAILSIALTSIYRLHGQTMDISGRARFYSQAPLLAQGKLSEIERDGIEEARGDSGDFGEIYPDYRWAVSVEEVQSELLKDDNYHMVRLDISISLGTDADYHLRTYRFYAD